MTKEKDQECSCSLELQTTYVNIYEKILDIADEHKEKVNPKAFVGILLELAFDISYGHAPSKTKALIYINEVINFLSKEKEKETDD